jgi:hypothetical protein
MPHDTAGYARGALFAVADGESSGAGHPGAATALRYLAGAFYGSLCREGGRALDSALGMTTAYLRSLAATGHYDPHLSIAALVVQDRRLWLATTGPCVAYVLRAPAGEWRVVESAPAPHSPGIPHFAPRPEVYARPGVPIPLETGDVVLLGSAALQTRLTERVLKNALLAMVSGDPGATAENLAEVLVRLAESKPGAGTPGAVVLRCGGILPAADAMAQGWPASHRLARGLPAAFPWKFAALQDQATSGPAHPVRGGKQTAPLYTVPTEGAATRPIPVTGGAATRPVPVDEPVLGPAIALTAAAPPPAVPPPAPRATSPAPTAPPAGAPAPPAAHPRPSLAAPASLAADRSPMIPWPDEIATWVAAAPRLARVMMPATALLAGAGTLTAWITENVNYLLFGCSLGGLLLCTAHLPRYEMVQRLTAGGSAALAKSRLQAAGRGVTGALPYTPPARPAPAPPHASTTGAVTWAKDRLLLPPAGAVREGCLDIASLKDGAGRIVAQVVLVCPRHLLGAPGCPGGVYVVLHDLVAGQQRMVAWLAPGQRRLDAVEQDVTAYGGNPAAAVRWLRGGGTFELASSRLRVLLRLEGCRLADPVRKQHLEALEVVITGVQAVA